MNNACARAATEAVGRTDLLDRLVAVAIDEVKYKKGHKYLTVVCDRIPDVGSFDVGGSDFSVHLDRYMAAAGVQRLSRIGRSLAGCVESRR